MPRETDLAYLAGVVDADGFVTAAMRTRVGTTEFHAQVGITGSSREPHDLAAELFGGQVNMHRPSTRPGHLMQFHWQRNGLQAVPVITALLPYLRIKAHRAALVLDLQEQILLIRAAREAGDPAPWLPPGQDPTEGLPLFVAEIRDKHKRHGRITA